MKQYGQISFSPRSDSISLDDVYDESENIRRGFARGFDNATALLSSLITEVEQFWDDRGIYDRDPVDRLAQIFRRFHQVARRMRARHSNRPTLEVADEYDVQDLLHAILIIDFDDVRSEEWTPSYAGACARCDFLLKAEQVVVEVKKTRKGLGAREVGEQLIIDVQRYQGHPDCGTLVCFVYDPEGLVANPRGVINDLESRSTPELPVRVFIEPG